ncbi:3-dehydroquinate synthase [Herpetosiphon llansteffanensis]|uniref:3-dehydroquinate synthase n=1 Tax=Herpetosiphon llansteffanensis TaxID=2094568 RepID=UPI000D7C636E
MAMRSIQQAFEVRYSYPVHCTYKLFDLANPCLAEIVAPAPSQPKLWVVLDQAVAEHHPTLLAEIAAYAQASQAFELVEPSLVLAGGEAIKHSSEPLQAVYTGINRYAIDRHSYVMAIGGGALIDMVGYAAATAHRGVRLIRVPTTVLAQNDAAVGVKNSINAFGKKNFLGTFAPPYAVLNDSHFLTTLSERDWRSGIAEAIKVALLKDAAFFATIERTAPALQQRDLNVMQDQIFRCAELHLAHIAGGDPFERGSARPLDFGHWAAHKLEYLSDYSLRHGEAVAIGIALDCTYGYLKGDLAEAPWQRVLNCLTALGFDLYHPALSSYLAQIEHPQSLLSGLTEFREHLGGQLTITLIRDIGQPYEVHTIDLTVMQQAIRYLAERA